MSNEEMTTKWRQFENWFRTEFPDDDDSALYGKAALFLAWLAGLRGEGL